MEKPNEEPRKHLPGDEEEMQAVLRNAKGILMKAHLDALMKDIKEERAGQANALEEGKEILEKAAEREESYLAQTFGDFLESFPPEHNFYQTMNEQFGWSKHQTIARLDALQIEFERLYDSEFDAPDEKQPAAGMRNSKAILKQFLAEDYGLEFAESISPLVDIFVDKSTELIRQKPKESGEDMQAV
jgi:hypothetical protein